MLCLSRPQWSREQKLNVTCSSSSNPARVPQALGAAVREFGKDLLAALEKYDELRNEPAGKVHLRREGQQS